MVESWVESMFNETLAECWVSTENIWNPEGYVSPLTQHLITGHLHFEMNEFASFASIEFHTPPRNPEILHYIQKGILPCTQYDSQQPVSEVQNSWSGLDSAKYLVPI